jgi:hypothetical protein
MPTRYEAPERIAAEVTGAEVGMGQTGENESILYKASKDESRWHNGI